MRASRAVQLTTQEALASVNERLDNVVQQQRNIVDRVGELGERGNLHERGLLELSDKVKQSVRELNNCTDIASKSLESSAQSFTAVRELQTESMRASRTIQLTTQDALASLNERLNKQDSEIRSLHFVRQQVGFEGSLDRQRREGDRADERISEISTRLDAACFEVSSTKTEVGRKLQEISDSHVANYRSFERVVANISDGLQTCQSDLHRLRAETTQGVDRLVSELTANSQHRPEADNHSTEIKLLVTPLESRLQNIAELMKDELDKSCLHSVMADLQTQRSDKMQETSQPDSLTAIISRSEGFKRDS
jgi:hypothetical protein